MTPSRASRIDFDVEDENDGQISAREPLQNSGRDYKDIYDNKLRYEKSQVNIQKRTKTPIDKVRVLYTALDFASILIFSEGNLCSF